jgi:3-methyladenine DNA glycosylase Tag
VLTLTQPDPRNPSAALAVLLDHCDTSATPGWRDEIANRSRRAFRPLPDDREIMRHVCVAIAYSQGARSSMISRLIEAPIFTEAFAGFDPAALARRDPELILAGYWSRLGHLRFRNKIHRIIQCAQALNGIIGDCGSFADYLEGFEIPRRIRNAKHIEQFWQRFNALQSNLQRREMPFFRSTTSLLQLLLDLDYDSVKPDLIVMRLARRIGIVERETGDRAFRQCVRFLQTYSIANGCRAAEIDLALLAFGGQSGARQLLTQTFCPSSDPCNHLSCMVAENNLCLAQRTDRPARRHSRKQE